MLPSVRICCFDTIMAPALTAEATNQTANSFAIHSNRRTHLTTHLTPITPIANITEESGDSDAYNSDIAANGHHQCLSNINSNNKSRSGIVRFRFSLKDTKNCDNLNINSLNSSLKREARFISLSNLSSAFHDTNQLYNSEDINMSKGLSNGHHNHNISLTDSVNNDNAINITSTTSTSIPTLNTTSSSFTTSNMGLLNNNNKDTNLTHLLLLKTGKPENGQRIDFTNISWSDLKQQNSLPDNVTSDDNPITNIGDEERTNLAPLPPHSSLKITENFEQQSDALNEDNALDVESCQQMETLSSKSSDIKSAQLSLQKQTEKLMRRIRRLQFKQTHRHINKEMKSFVEYEQNVTGISCQRQVIHRQSDNMNLLSHVQSVSNPVEDRLKMLTPEGVKGLSTSALVNLVKKLGSSSANSDAKSFHDLCLQQSQTSSSNVQSSPFSQQSMHQTIPNTLSSTGDCNTKSFQRSFLSNASQLPTVSSDVKQSLLNTIDTFTANLRHFETGFDSDATESSSGGESCDEFEDYNQDISKRLPSPNRDGNSVPLKKRSCWKWCLERGAIGSRWTWLQAQVADLEFRIRQQNEMYRQLRATKGVITFGCDGDNNLTVPTAITPNLVSKVCSTSTTPTSSGSGNTNSQHLCCGSDNTNTSSNSCMRTLGMHSIRKRKLVRSLLALSGATRKAAKYSTVQCACNGLPLNVSHSPCVLCNGRYSYVHVIDTDCMPYYERVALLDSSTHPVLSLSNDVSLGLHFSELLKRETIQRPITSRQQNRKRKGPQSTSTDANKIFDSKNKSQKRSQSVISSEKLRRKYDCTTKRKYTRRTSSSGDGVWRKRGRPRERVSSGSSRTDSPIPSPSPSDNSSCGNLISSAPLHRRRRSEQHAYDINNIVIPYSIAATTRVEKLQYKEIITPKWRVNEPLDAQFTFSDQLIKKEASNLCAGDGNEDISDNSFSLRHLKCEEEERKRILAFMKGGQTGSSHLRGRGSRVRFDSGRSDNVTAIPACAGGSGGDGDGVSVGVGDGVVHSVDTNTQTDYFSAPNSSLVQTNINTDVSLCASVPETLSSLNERRRTISVSSKRDDSIDDDNCAEALTPFDLRTFPLSDIECDILTKQSDDIFPFEDNIDICTDPEKSNEGTITANNSTAPSPIMSDTAESIADHIDVDNEDEDPEWEPKKIN